MSDIKITRHKHVYNAPVDKTFRKEENHAPASVERRGILFNGGIDKLSNLTKILFMRQSYDRETQVRNKVIDFITHTALQTENVVYLSPSQAQKQLDRKGIIVSIDYVLRRYADLGIVRENGLWVRKIGNE